MNSTRHLLKWFNETCEKENIDTNFAQGCSEPGYDDKPVILANWNNIHNKVFDSLESHGFSCEWEDEWIICDNCYKAFRSAPDSYSWEMYGHIFDGYALCGDCIEWDEYLESIENTPKMAVTCSLFSAHKDEVESRYTMVKDGFENGFHPGQNDDAESILKSMLEHNPNGRFIFVIDDQGQFDIEFSIYQKKEQ